MFVYTYNGTFKLFNFTIFFLIFIKLDKLNLYCFVIHNEVELNT